MVVRVENKILIPTPHTTSLTFGGPNYSHLFVTTGITYTSKLQKQKYPNSGQIFKVTSILKSFYGAGPANRFNP